MSKSVALLLGAGFSAPKGYPIGNKLNEYILACDGTEFGFSQSGNLCVDTRTGKRPTNLYRNHFEVAFEFCRVLIHHYNDKNKPFDYEEFYDYIIEDADKDKSIEEVTKPFLIYEKSTSDLVHKLPTIYNQLVGFYLKDGDGKKWYDDQPYSLKPLPTEYSGILSCLESFGNEGIVHIHTLNHDLYFERLANTEWLGGSGNLSDGFEEFGSPYFGKLDVDRRNYKVRLQHYTEKYDSKFRLYKLHGSRDYGLYYSGEQEALTPSTYIKTRYGVGFGDFYKEIENKDGTLKYENCWINYHADFLTGTTSKIERYREPLLYKKLFQYFRSNLEEAEQLIIVGYGAKDEEVNRMLLEHFDHQNKPSFIVDPYAGDTVNELQKKLGAQLIETQLGDLTIEELT